jgi:phosphoribosyl-AMP cyclohydrolase
MDKQLEEGSRLQLDFTKLAKVAATGAEVVPAIAQDVDTGEVLILGYVNQLALDTALQERKATFWSTSRNELWIKGKTSGDYLELIEVRINCEQNSILYRVRLAGAGSCHTKNQGGTSRLGCYYRRILPDGTLGFLEGQQ